jgi:asparagine synthase (glutamine-hydrolysing)
VNFDWYRPIARRRTRCALAHRGTGRHFHEGRAYRTDGALGLRHRRLAIIDLSDRPATSRWLCRRTGATCVVYNGEIYNFRELRGAGSPGLQFRSRTDTEVVLQALPSGARTAVSGSTACSPLRSGTGGARAVPGARPLRHQAAVLGRMRGTFLFGSEIKALTAAPGLPARLDKEALLEYFTFQNFFTDRTPVRGRAPAAGRLRSCAGLCERGSAAARVLGLQLPGAGESRGTTGEYAEELDRLLQQAVNRQLVSDVDVGAYLSGGMDSGVDHRPRRARAAVLQTFTCGFDLTPPPASSWASTSGTPAELMSYRFKTEHYEMVLKAGDMERACRSWPGTSRSRAWGRAIRTTTSAQLASKFVKVVLCGTGGDELFGGYPLAVLPRRRQRRLRALRRQVLRLLAAPDAEPPSCSKVFAPIWPT